VTSCSTNQGIRIVIYIFTTTDTWAADETTLKTGGIKNSIESGKNEFEHHSDSKHEPELLIMAPKKRVYVAIEPPIKWPLWFDLPILDDEAMAPISAALKADARALCASFANGTLWCTKTGCYYWVDQSALISFRSRSKEFGVRLRAELGDAYEVGNLTASVSNFGHAEVISEYDADVTEGVWYPHSCVGYF
jgi:hypothetical protein